MKCICLNDPLHNLDGKPLVIQDDGKARDMKVGDVCSLVLGTDLPGDKVSGEVRVKRIQLALRLRGATAPAHYPEGIEPTHFDKKLLEEQAEKMVNAGIISSLIYCRFMEALGNIQLSPERA